MILPRKRVIGVFFALAMTVQMGYYFELLEFGETPVALFDFRNASFPHIPAATLLPPLHTLCNKTKPHPNVFINCSSISLPTFEAINQLQVCIRWAVDAGVGVIRPTFITHEFMRSDIEFLLDESFLWQTLTANCPWLEVVDASEFPENYTKLVGDPFFPGKVYRKGSYNRYLQVRLNDAHIPPGTPVVMQENGSLWGWERRRDPAPLQVAFKHLFRFSRPLVTIAERLLSSLPFYFFGAVLTSTEDSFKRNEFEESILDAVLRSNTSSDPVLYVACQDGRALEEFAHRAQLRRVVATHKLASAQDAVNASWMTRTLTVEQMKVVDHLVLRKAFYVFGSAESVDAFTLGTHRHLVQFGDLEYHGVDRQQHLFGSTVHLWDGNSW